MGMGEPLLNYENLKGAVSILCSELGFGLAARKITVSTAGHVPGIRRLAEDFPKLGLAISLNSAEEEVRRKLMPIARRYSLGELKGAAKYYVQKTGRRVTFEYILIDGVTDTPVAAKRLVAFVGDLPCKINLIVYNTAPGLPKELQPSPPDAVTGFRDYLYPRTPAVTIRKSKGADILAACGQLAGAGS
jgi:23S rRNA (adenine2503-C2)-methyltransferase